MEIIAKIKKEPRKVPLLLIVNGSVISRSVHQPHTQLLQ